MKLILFDIDGTLLHTDGLSKDLFFESLSETFSVSINPGNIPWGGLTDKGIAEHALQQSGIDAHEIRDGLPMAFDLLGKKWAARGSIDHFTIYPEAVALLEMLAQHSAVSLGVLTANCHQGAHHKLRLSNLSAYFDLLITGDLVSERDRLPSFVPDRAQHQFSYPFGESDCVIIGDTPADISCARACNMSVVAVATGRYSQVELAQQKPDLLLSNLAPTPELLSFLS